uniref:Uncharacterized protein n=1 Tax=Anguilla anguilla TaxID=7936 RepID=A0A0E9RIF7_ANGAN
MRSGSASVHTLTFYSKTTAVPLRMLRKPWPSIPVLLWPS